jgi:hypothetical protein
LITNENGDELKIIKLTFLWIIFSFVFGCGDEPGKPTDNNSELLPLKVGNQWTYAYTSFNSDGDSTHTEIKTYEIIKDSVYNGEKIYYLNRSDFLGLLIKGYFLNRNDGIHVLNTEHGAADPQILLKFPVDNNSEFDAYPYRMKVGKADTTIATPAGEFKCIKYSKIYDKDKPFYIHYFCPGIGNIASEYYFKNIGEDY